MFRQCLLVLLLCGFLTVASGCQGNQAAAPPSELTAVPISHPVERMVTVYADFTGRTDAVQAVDLKARVTGYLTKMPFREGSEVHEGELLFEIDPRPYQAQYDQAMSQVELNEASLKLARTTYDRDRAIAANVPGAVSQQQLDQDLASVDEAMARVKASKASTEVYKLNLDFTRVTSPINGQISRYYMTRGNLVNQDQTLLSTVVSLDPMFAYFDMDEPTLLNIRRAISSGRIQLPQEGTIPVFMQLQGENEYPHRGAIDFLNNQVNSATGSISMRGVFPNPITIAKSARTSQSLPDLAATAVALAATPFDQGPLAVLPVLHSGMPKSTRMLSPGMFVRIRLPIGEPQSSLLVIDRAIMSDQGLKYVYVVDANNKVQYKRVTTRSLEPDGLRVVEGLGADEWVVVGGLQQVRPRMEIRPDQIAMPSLGQTAGTDASAGK